MSKTRIGANPSRVNAPELVSAFHNHMDEIGDHVVYLRKDLRVKHNCWVTVSRQPEGLSVCPVCYGTGYAISLERHLVRDYEEASPGRQSQALEQASPGSFETPSHSLAFKPSTRPKQGDIVFRVEWDETTFRPSALIEPMQINRVVNMKQEQGILVFYKCYAQVWSVNTIAIEDLLRAETRIRAID